MSASRFLRGVGILALPVALGLRALAFSFPTAVESIYARRVYPLVARTLGAANAWLPIPLAEIGAVAAFLLVIGLFARWWRRQQESPRLRRVVGGLVFTGWAAAGVGTLLFQFAWGFNYARPTLSQRLDLDVGEVGATEVLDLAEDLVELANQLYGRLDADPTRPTELGRPVDELDAAIDRRFRQVALPGDYIESATSPAKRLLSAPLFARLGIAGIFIPFTGEPLFNGLVPDAAIPVSMAHEKAHQRGITDEGEANLAALLVCLSMDDDYPRYAAALNASATLLGAAARYEPERTRDLAAHLAPGARRDLQAIREFWTAYRGRATRAASRVNDAYLRSNRVEGGIQSYGRVTSMLVGLRRGGRLQLGPPLATELP